MNRHQWISARRPDDAAATDQAAIRVESLSKVYGRGANAVLALADVTLGIEGGEFLTLLGPSGSGKTTFLHVVAGLQEASRGRVLVADRDITTLPPHKRDVGVVFQSYALFPHLTVFENVAFPLRLRKLGGPAIRREVQQALDLVQLETLAERYPAQLSGGQQQRVAIARAVVFRPNLLLLDEPLGALDRQLREHMQLELRSLQREVGITCVYVTHDQEEAMTMSDRIAVLEGGVMQQLGTPREIYEHPANPFVTKFVGRVNMWTGHVREVRGEQVMIELDGGVRITAYGTVDPGERVHVAVRPEAIDLIDCQPLEQPNMLAIRVESVRFAGSNALVLGALEGNIPVLIESRPSVLDRVGAADAAIAIDPNAISVFVVDEHEAYTQGEERS